MNSIYDFIVEPIGDRYDNIKTVGGKDLILNTKVESWKFVNRLAKVIAVPIALHTSIKIGDTIVVHQNNPYIFKEASLSFRKLSQIKLSICE